LGFLIGGERVRPYRFAMVVIDTLVYLYLTVFKQIKHIPCANRCQPIS